MTKTKEQLAQYNKTYYEKHLDKIKDKRKKHYQENKKTISVQHRAYVTHKKYGLTKDQVLELLYNQGQSCAVCKVGLVYPHKNTHIDHDHDTGKIRGILCTNCNTGLGQFKDNVSVLAEAIKYLNENKR